MGRGPAVPGFKTLARRMGVDGHVGAKSRPRLGEQKGYLRQLKRIGTTNHFELTPLFVCAEKLQAYEAGQREPLQPPRRRGGKAPATGQTIPEIPS